MAGNTNIEQELKLELSESGYYGLAALWGRPLKVKEQLNIFFDDQTGSLRAQKWALRLRDEGDRWFMTAKGPALSSAGGVYVRPEYEKELSGGEFAALLEGFALKTIDKAPCRELANRFGDLDLKPMLRFNNLRQTFNYQGYELALDKTYIKNRVLYELEVEADDIEPIRSEIELLFDQNNWPYVPSKQSKLKRALKIHGFDSA